MGGWTALVDGASMTMNSLPAGANWEQGILERGGRHAPGKRRQDGLSVSPQSYSDFEIRAEFWADANCNSGIFIRCQDPEEGGCDNSYEVNIFDKRPDPSYGTAAIVDFAKAPTPYPQAADKWNTFEITARGDQLVVVFNGQKTVDIRNSKYRAGR